MSTLSFRMRKIAMVLAAAAAPKTLVMAQIIEKPIAFEVVSLKAAPALDMGAILKDPSSVFSMAQAMGMKVDSGFVNAQSVPLASLIMRAYGVKPGDFVAPDWAAKERFVFRDLSAAALKQDDKGNTSITIPGRGTVRASSIDGNPLMGTHMEIPSITLKALAPMLGRYVGQPVLDETGMDGFYAVTLDVSMADLFRSTGRPMPPSLDDSSGTDVRSSLRKQGLLLTPRKVPLTVLVVDHLDKVPTEN